MRRRGIGGGEDIPVIRDATADLFERIDFVAGTLEIPHDPPKRLEVRQPVVGDDHIGNRLQLHGHPVHLRRLEVHLLVAGRLEALMDVLPDQLEVGRRDRVGRIRTIPILSNPQPRQVRKSILALLLRLAHGMVRRHIQHLNTKRYETALESTQIDTSTIVPWGGKPRPQRRL